MFKFDTKIAAIGAIKKLKINIVESTNEYGSPTQALAIALSLNEIKQLVEAIMALVPLQESTRVTNLENDLDIEKKHNEDMHGTVNNLRKGIVEFDLKIRELQKEKEDIEGLRRVHSGCIEQINELRIENSRLRSMTKNIIHCDECGSDWFAGGFNGSKCSCTEINELENLNNEANKRINEYKKNSLELRNKLAELRDSIYPFPSPKH